MQIRPHDIKRFKNLYLDKFGLVLDNNQAETSLLFLISQIEKVYQPISQTQLISIQKDVDENSSHEQTRTTIYI